MTWKNTLRKAPFSIGDAQTKTIDQDNARKKQLLGAFPKFLEQHLDSELKEEILDNPNRDSYTIFVPAVANEITTLKRNGIQNSDLIQLLREEYKAKSVEIGGDGEIKFIGVIAL